MPSDVWTAKAPANVALVKYMGKAERNVPHNISLSYTLEGLYTEVRLRLLGKSGTGSTSLGVLSDVFTSAEFSELEKKRFLKHLGYIKKILNFEGLFTITSSNSFPKAAGVASSASSFAALTLCAFQAISDLQGVSIPSKEFMSSISRVGSGSSCRSFFSPWCLWEGEKAESVDIPLLLEHQLILVDPGVKEVSSTEAHRRVQTSLLMNGRAARASSRCSDLIIALQRGHWDAAFQLCWEDFWDMHALFETSRPSFGYMLPKTLYILHKVREFWKKYGEGPIATLDAGPNVHLLWKKKGKTSNQLQIFRDFCKS